MHRTDAWLAARDVDQVRPLARGGTGRVLLVRLQAKSSSECPVCESISAVVRADDEALATIEGDAHEIRAGNELGMHTVRIHRGEFAAQQPQMKEEQPDYVVGNISQVKSLPFRWDLR